MEQQIDWEHQLSLAAYHGEIPLLFNSLNAITLEKVQSKRKKI